MTSRFSRYDWFRIGLLGLVFAAMLWGFRSMLTERIPIVFSDPEEDLSFGYIVPIFSAYVVWNDRKTLREAVGEPSWLGFLAILPCLLVGFLGARGAQVRMEIVAFAGLLLSVPWALFGTRVAARLVFPAGFLLFCVPLTTFFDVFTVHLRLFATSVAYEILHGFGLDVVRRGSMLAAAGGSFSLDVAAPCSGLRSIFALMALTAAYAYFTQKTWLKRAILFATAVPLAVLGNVVRILTICLVATAASREFALGFYHDYSGYLVFFVAIAAMVGIGEALRK